MAPSYSKPPFGGIGKNTSGRHIVAIILLACVKKIELFKGEYILIKCHTNPSDASLPTYALHFPYLKTGTPEELLNWIFNCKNVCTGHNCDTAKKKYAMAKILLDGN